MRDELDNEAAEAASLGLNPEVLKQQARTLRAAVNSGTRPIFPIVDTCRIDNGGLTLFGQSVPRRLEPGRIVALVPAAGAASRYSAPLAALAEAIETKNVQAATTALTDLATEGARSWPLPANVLGLLETPSRIHELSDVALAQLLADLTKPKALMPCVEEGMSFLALKHAEHAALPGLAGEVFITPFGGEKRFRETLRSELADGPQAAKTDFRSEFLEQGPDLSTLRFHRDGRPFREPDGRLSLVPAGHGALAQLFPKVGELFPQARSVFIRNIDNVMGTGADVIHATTAFLAAHDEILEHVLEIRTAIEDRDVRKAARAAQSLYQRTGTKALTPGAESEEATLALLTSLQDRLFRTPAAQDLRKASWEQLSEWYARPVTTMGQVPNTGKDVGGTPCFVRAPDGVTKLCLEVPHASPEDRKAFLEAADRATHFNPVFVAAEITADPFYYAKRNRDFWLLSEKTYRGQPVMYFETVLYELLGNSALANALFTPIPRSVFNPHKTLKDAMGRQAKHWLMPRG